MSGLWGSPSGTAPTAPCTAKDVLEGNVVSYADKIRQDSQDFDRRNFLVFVAFCRIARIY